MKEPELFYSKNILKAVGRFAPDPEKAALLLFLLCIVTAALTAAFSRVYLLDYSPINGDFQSYNVFRRMLDGQVPYRDFSNYPGSGFVLINLPLLLFSGGSFADSLCITNFTSALSYCLIITMLLYTVTSNRMVALLGGAGIILLPDIMPALHLDFFLNYLPFTGLAAPGNSMRVERALLPFLAVAVALVLMKLKRIDLGKVLQKKSSIACLGYISGLLVPWSFDFGYATLFAALITIAIFQGYAGQPVKNVLSVSLVYFLIPSLSGYLLSVTAITFGNPASYFNFLAGAARYQFWYYGTTPDKLLTISSLLANRLLVFYLLLVVLLAACFGIKYFRNNLKDHDFIAFFLNLAVLLAVLAYIYGSGGFAWEIATLTAYLTVAGVSVKYLLKFLSGRGQRILNQVGILVLAGFLLINIGLLYEAVRTNRAERAVPWQEELGGYLTIADDLLETGLILEGEPYFSTYAGALEVVTGSFQPTGTDYIIHVLGDQMRADYLDHFITNNYRYATTIRSDLIPPEAWCKRANWFWYRELFKHYQPLATLGFHVIWEKLETPAVVPAAATVKINKTGEHSCTIIVECDSDENLVADLFLSYSSAYIATPERFQTFRKAVIVEDPGMASENSPGWRHYYIPEESAEYLIPVTLLNGQGQVTLSSLPAGATSLKINQVTVLALLPNQQ